MTRARGSSIDERARALDAEDELAGFRRAFSLPRANDLPVTYLCGHSLGLMPHRARAALEHELDRWATRAVGGHFGTDGWFAYHERFSGPLARLAGARTSEVVAMNSLTVNLHLMLASFFAPKRQHDKILIEHDVFPSDRYALESHLRWHGLDPEDALVQARPADAALGITAEDLAGALRRERGQIAIVLLPGVQYLTGQVLDMQALTAVAHAFDALIGFDLAHAIGNVPLRMHSWDVDFAVWCSYKYLNGGPGAIGGCYVHARHGDEGRRRLAGWWGHAESLRFSPTSEFRPIPGADGWQISNPPIFSMAPLLASLDLFDTARRARLHRKSTRLTRFLDAAIETELGEAVEIITPRDRRGAQLSLRIRSGRPASEIEAELRTAGVVVDVRAPDIVRLAPVPLYNRFRDVARAIRVLRRCLA